MPEIVLTVLKWLFLALLYLFIARAIRIIYLDLVGPRAPRQKGGRKRGRSRGKPRAISVAEPDQPLRTIPLNGETTLGHGEGATVPLTDTYVSSLHARLFSKDNTWFVEDLGSTNGTYLNRVKVTAPTPLAVGDELRLGKTVIEVRR